MHPAEALDEIAYLLEIANAPSYRTKAFRTAEQVVRDMSSDELAKRIANKSLTDLSGIGPKTAQVIIETASGEVPKYLLELRKDREQNPSAEKVDELLAALRGDCHTHSNWSDGRASIEEMAIASKNLGHEYNVLTDHSPRLTIANGLTPDRLRQELEIVAKLNEQMAPYRILTGIEVDILDEGELDQEDDLLAQLDVVVGSIHSKLRMDGKLMTKRMCTALANPHLDILGHCTGRKVQGRPRPESEFDPEMVFHAAAQFGKPIEINASPDRQDPPMRLLTMAFEMGCMFSIDTDAHAPGELEWLIKGCRRAADVGIPPERIVNTKTANELIAWTNSHV